jgi:hypothetical protein
MSFGDMLTLIAYQPYVATVSHWYLIPHKLLADTMLMTCRKVSRYQHFHVVKLISTYQASKTKNTGASSS